MSSWTPSNSPWGRKCLAALGAGTLAWLLVATTALADDRAAAKSLFEAGRTLMKQAKYDQACPKFVESLRLHHTLSGLLNLARCHELQGKTASAWSGYSQVISEARKSGDSDREKLAKRYARELEPRLSKLTIVAKSPTPGLILRRDDVELGSAALGVPIVIDPGQHRIEASAPGYQPWSTNVTVGPDGDQQQIVVPPLKPVAPVSTPIPTRSAPTSAALVPPAPVTASPTEPPSRSSGLNPYHYAAISFGALGLAGVVVGSVYGAGAISDWDEAQQYCDGIYCDPPGIELADDARTAGHVATGAFIVGSVGLTAGLIFWLAAPDDTPNETARVLKSFTPTLVPLVSAHGGMLLVGGTL